jgi:hypothetical protein
MVQRSDLTISQKNFKTRKEYHQEQGTSLEIDVNSPYQCKLLHRAMGETTLSFLLRFVPQSHRLKKSTDHRMKLKTTNPARLSHGRKYPKLPCLVSSLPGRAKPAMEKSGVLVVGGTGYIGRRIVRASLEQGHPTSVLLRPEIGLDIDKLQMLLSFKAQGAHLVEASLDDHAGLVAAVSQVDVVISAMSGVHFRSHNLHLQHKLTEAIKEAGNVKVRRKFLIHQLVLHTCRQVHKFKMFLKYLETI